MKKIMTLFLAVCMLFCITACKTSEEKETDKGIKEENETLKVYCYSQNNLNPLIAANEGNMQMLRLIFESLVQCDETQKAKLQLASSCSVSSDGIVWGVELKKGIKWHDGSDFTARDVIYSYEYVMQNPETSSYAINVANIQRINFISDYEIAFVLKTPQANFINLLEVPIVKDGQAKKSSLIGTGPYRYKETVNKIIHLTANADWHGGKLGVKNIQVKILPDKETVTYAYVSKEIDMVSVNSGQDMGKYSSNADNLIIDYPSNVFTFISVNTATEPLSNRMFRKAIAHSIDKETINSEVLLSHGSVANSCMNTNWWVYNPGVTNYVFDKEKAVKALEVVKENMKIAPVNLMVNDDNPDKRTVAEMIKENLKANGIVVNVEYVDWATFTERVATGNYQMYLGSIKYGADINPQYVVTNPSPELQTLFADLQKQTTDDGILGKYFEIQEKIALELEIIPLYFDASAVMYNKRITGDFTPCRINMFDGISAIKLGN